MSDQGTDEGYARGLKNRQISMMAIGGAIGTGLFLGAGAAIETSGPALIASYAVAGVVIFLIMRALGELLMYRPVSRSFVDYAEEFVGRFAGFATGWVYWLMWVVTAMAEITAAGIYVQYWFPDIPQWVTAAVVLGLLFLANLISVKVFGEFEFWFSMIKVVTIVGAIVLGLAVIVFGIGPAGEHATFAHLVSDGGFLPHGAGSALLALQSVMFAYLGVELIGLTAGEAENPRVVLPKAINSVMVRIGVFYVGALVVLLSLVPWTEFHDGESPFVRAFDAVGIHGAAGIIQFVVLTAALSSCNSGIYSTGRMLRTLAVHRSAPAAFGKLSKRQVPAASITASAIVMAAGILVNAVVPEKAFAYITSVATVGVLWTWGVIVVCQLVYRRRSDSGELPASEFRMPGAPWTGYLALAFLALVVVLLGFGEDTRVALYVTPIVAVVIGVGYLLSNRPARVRQRA
ncbi:amino acid permease [Amycolatopsis methanolica]|uniref:Putative amino acid transporter n=1 Tax=Amycolatopsis methanolica 239 TaxID=1068978 RepID=A0A076N5F1_AMYME|nr:amino acid permease [Amycolatopsis methanolica]AIJ26050.1 putative amino acid transporter [Amycolatopsis methanolica 239]